MKLTVVVQLVLKLTPRAQVKWDIIGDIQEPETRGLMQEMASLLDASQKQVHDYT